MILELWECVKTVVFQNLGFNHQDIKFQDPPALKHSHMYVKESQVAKCWCTPTPQKKTIYIYILPESTSKIMFFWWIL